MFASALRQVVRQASEGLVAEIGPAAVIVQILKENGTMDKHKLWQYCEVRRAYGVLLIFFSIN